MIDHECIFQEAFFYLCGNIIFVINISLVCLSFLWHFSTNSTIHSKGKRFLLCKSQRYIQHENSEGKMRLTLYFFLNFITSARASNIELGPRDIHISLYNFAWTFGIWKLDGKKVQAYWSSGPIKVNLKMAFLENEQPTVWVRN